MIKKIAVIVPAYNEEKAIAAVVGDINALDLGKNFAMTVVVVNDCSKDRTADIVRKLNCILLDLPVNLGIGGAVQTGFIYAYENGFDYAMQVDGDGQHPPSEIPKLLKTIDEAGLDIVIGSRFIEKSGFKSTFSRRMGINFFRYVIRLFCGITITDSTSGFRIINRKTLSIVCEHYPDEYPEPESIILYHSHHLKIGEVAVEMRERQGGVSSIRMFNSLYYMLKVSVAILFTYIRYKNKKLK
jgi:glycosyltransferase involved in cell wall biosynthesis